jgi:type IV fimbrial biogenesis protein FimT
VKGLVKRRGDQRKASARQPSLRGLTLIEMTIALAILGVVVAMGAPSYLSAARQARLVAASDEVAAFTDLARRRAHQSGRCVRVRVTAGNALFMEARNTPDCVNLGIDGWTNLQTFIAENGVVLGTSFTAGTTEIVFRPNGRLRGDGDAETNDDAARITLTAPGHDRSRSVTVTAIGRVCSQGYAGAMVPVVAAGDTC